MRNVEVNWGILLTIEKWFTELAVLELQFVCLRANGARSKIRNNARDKIKWYRKRGKWNASERERSSSDKMYSAKLTRVK